jgi:hypothetical protein
MKKRKIQYAEMWKKDGRPGYVLDLALHIKNKDIKNATRELYRQICNRLSDLEVGRGSPVKYFFIGKIFLHQGECYTLDPTWKLTGIPDGCDVHFGKYYGMDGLIVLAAISEHSIPADCRKSWYITDPEEYAQTLERRVTDIFVAKEDQRIVFELIERSDEGSKTPSVCLLYMVFTMEGMNVVR